MTKRVVATLSMLGALLLGATVLHDPVVNRQRGNEWNSAGATAFVGINGYLVPQP
jgi:hypothetical protein